MAEKTRIIEVYEKAGAFSSVFKRFSGIKQDYNYSDLALLRKLLSNEKARMLHVIKIKKPKSIYSLAKFLGRDFKTVRDDIILLKKFGLIDLISERSSKGNRISHRPILNATTLNIVIRV
jgi:predicted transcriptional regulator